MRNIRVDKYSSKRDVVLVRVRSPYSLIAFDCFIDRQLVLHIGNHKERKSGKAFPKWIEKIYDNYLSNEDDRRNLENMFKEVIQ